MKKVFLLYILIISTVTAYSQYSNNCATAEPFCTGTTYNFPLAYDGSGAGSGPQAETGPDYSCLYTTPSPVWYYLLIDQPGNIDIHMASSSGTDIDFTCWGPFSSLSGACGNLTATNTVDCSYSTAAQEDCNISNTLTGQFYLMCITNFYNTATNAVFSQSNIGQSGAGSTNCNIVYRNMTSLTAVPGACSPANNTYSVTGSVVFSGAPATGTLTITNSCSGTPQVFNAPFTSPQSYTFSNLTSTGTG
jgi:hypothetical protein